MGDVEGGGRVKNLIVGLKYDLARIYAYTVNTFKDTLISYTAFSCIFSVLCCKKICMLMLKISLLIAPLETVKVTIAQIFSQSSVNCYLNNKSVRAVASSKG